MAKASKPSTQEWDTISRSVEETRQLGKALGEAVGPGDCVALVGELGSGKTTLIQGLAEGMGLAREAVRSPTFILLREYPGPTPLVHLDGYRLENADAARWLDLEWLFSPYKVTVIEWADRLRACLPEDVLELRVAHRTTHRRLLCASSRGPRSRRLLDALTRVPRPQSVVPGERDRPPDAAGPARAHEAAPETTDSPDPR